MKSKKKPTAEAVIKDIKRRTRRIFSAEEKIKIILEGLRGEDSIAAICRRYGIHENLYYKWSKDFIEAGKRRLNGDTQRETNTSEVGALKQENEDLKMLVADLYLENRANKKNLNGYG
jgi:transposase